MFIYSSFLFFSGIHSATAQDEWTVTWDDYQNTCNGTQSLIKSRSYTTTKTTDDCNQFCLDEIYEYSLANPADYSDQTFCCEYSKTAASSSATHSFDYVCKNYRGEERYNKYTLPCDDIAGTDSQGETCSSWYNRSTSRMCGSYNIADVFDAFELCCACGGGTKGTPEAIKGADDD